MGKGRQQYKQLIESNFNGVADKIKSQRKNNNNKRRRRK